MRSSISGSCLKGLVVAWRRHQFTSNVEVEAWEDSQELEVGVDSLCFVDLPVVK